MAKKELTGAQEQIFLFIKSFSAKYGYPPTRKEIAEVFEYSSANAAQCHLEALVRKGAITIAPSTARGIKCLI